MVMDFMDEGIHEWRVFFKLQLHQYTQCYMEPPPSSFWFKVKVNMTFIFSVMFALLSIYKGEIKSADFEQKCKYIC